jgi:hypothetical protein
MQVHRKTIGNVIKQIRFYDRAFNRNQLNMNEKVFSVKRLLLWLRTSMYGNCTREVVRCFKIISETEKNHE